VSVANVLVASTIVVCSAYLVSANAVARREAALLLVFVILHADRCGCKSEAKDSIKQSSNSEAEKSVVQLCACISQHEAAVWQLAVTVKVVTMSHAFLP
jgi:hypothetical protein